MFLIISELVQYVHFLQTYKKPFIESGPHTSGCLSHLLQHQVSGRKKEILIFILPDRMWVKGRKVRT